MPPLVRFIVRHALIGIAVGWSMVAAMLVFDFAGLAGLIFTSGLAAVAIPMLLIGFGITFGSVQVGIAVMGLDDTPPPRRGRPLARAMTPVPVRTSRRRR
ncbi:MAG: hypothetical protein RLO50_05630 [Azospirillaceae bacterium]